MAILTTPDNLATPSSGQNYGLVTDLAAFADSAQSALMVKANYGVGTTTERNAALSKFPDGARWYDTTLSADYRRVAGAWVALADLTQYTGTKYYRWVNAAARTAQTGMVAGDKGYQIDTAVTYRYNGSAWKAWESDWITYTPTLTNFAIGTGGSAANSCAYRYEQGTVRVSFKFQFGTSGFSVSGDPIFTLPLNSAALAHTYVKRQGQAELWDSSGASISREAVIYQNAANLDKVMLYGLGTATSGTVYNISSTLPFTWAAADILAGEFTYTAA